MERKGFDLFKTFYSSFISYIIRFSKYNRGNYLIEKSANFESLIDHRFVYKSLILKKY